MKFCSKCKIEYNDKALFCKDCGSKLEMKEENYIKENQEKNQIIYKRPLYISILSIFLWLGGITGLIGGIFDMIFANIPFTLKFYNSIGFNYPLLLNVSFISIYHSIFAIIAAYGLWKLKKYGGVAAYFVIVMSGFLQFINIAIWGLQSFFGLSSLVGLMIDVILIILISFSWQHLRRSQIDWL